MASSAHSARPRGAVVGRSALSMRFLRLDGVGGASCLRSSAVASRESSTGHQAAGGGQISASVPLSETRGSITFLPRPYSAPDCALAEREKSRDPPAGLRSC